MEKEFWIAVLSFTIILGGLWATVHVVGFILKGLAMGTWRVIESFRYQGLGRKERGDLFHFALVVGGFWVILAVSVLTGCVEEPSDGLDIPPGCQCGEPLGELDRRLRVVEGAPTGTFTPPEGTCIPEGATMEVQVVYREGDYWLVWASSYLLTHEDSAPRVQTFGIPYPRSTGPTSLAVGNLGSSPYTIAAGLRTVSEYPTRIISLTTETVVVSAVIDEEWTFIVPLLPIPSSAMVPRE